MNWIYLLYYRRWHSSSDSNTLWINHIWNYYLQVSLHHLVPLILLHKLFCSCSQKARPPNVKPPEYLILERRKKEDMLENYRKNTQYMEFNDLKNEWERSTDRKIKLNTVKRKVDSLLLDSQFTIEDRRERYQKIVVRVRITCSISLF